MMLGKLALLAQSKVAVAVLGVVVVGGTGTAAAAATGHLPALSAVVPGVATSLVATPTRTSKSQGADTNVSATPNVHAHTVNFVGTLTACGGTPVSSISVLLKDGKTQQVIAVNAQTTRVTGEHVTTLSELCAASELGHTVEVAATQQAGVTYLAWKVTAQGTTNGAGQGQGQGQGANQGQGQGNANAHAGTPGAASSAAAMSVTGVVQTVTASGSSTSVTVLKDDGTTVTIQLTSQTQFSGRVHSANGLTAGLRVTILAAQAADGPLTAEHIVG